MNIVRAASGKAVKAFMIGLLVAGIATVAAFHAPSVMFARPGWFDGGIRLLRDDGEVSYYFLHSSWIDRSGQAVTLTQDYPPLGVLYFSLPRLLTKNFEAFEVAFVSLNAVLYALLFVVMSLLLDGEGRSKRRLAFFLLPAFLYFSLWRFDILPTLLAAGALLAAKRKAPEPAFLLLLAAAMAKWYAALFFPPFFIYFALLGGREIPIKRLQNAIFLTAGAGIALIALVASVAGFGALVEPVLFHLSRDFEMGSVGAVLLTGMRAVGIDRPLLHGALARLFFLMQFAAVIPVVWKEYPKDFRSLVRACVFVLIPFMALGSVFSAQWIVWLAPLVLVVADATDLALLAALDLTVFVQFPVLFGINPYGSAYAVFTFIRSGLFAALWWRNSRAFFSRAQRMPQTLPEAGGQLPPLSGSYSNRKAIR